MDTACHGLSFQTGVKDNEWALSIDLEGNDEAEQIWRLYKALPFPKPEEPASKTETFITGGTDTPQRIIHQACIIVTGRGGEVDK